MKCDCKGQKVHCQNHNQKRLYQEDFLQSHKRMNSTFEEMLVRPHKIDSMFYLRNSWKSYSLHAGKTKKTNKKTHTHKNNQT